MANRPKGYGLSAETATKIASKYDPQMEHDAINWIAAVIEEDFAQERSGMKAVHEMLKDGRILCRLMNALKPGVIKKINEQDQAFKKIENIGNFLKAAEEYGVSKLDLFQAADLYENQNMTQVITAIHAVGRKAQANNYQGPVLGPKESSINNREFTEEQLASGRNVIGLQMGSNKGANQSGMNFGKTRAIID